mgnify:CR=1 FL=1
MITEQQKSIIKKHQNSFPVEMIPLAHDFGLKVYNVSGWPDDLSGMIKLNKKDANNPRYEIYVNKNHAATRRRFTIAHEISHFLLHKDLIGDGIVDDGLYRSKLPGSIETEANRLAADLLMPWGLINQAMSIGYNTVQELANALNVSPSAMSIRLGVPFETQNSCIKEAVNSVP